MKKYEHRQTGYVLLGALGAAVLLLAYLTAITNFNLGALLLLAFMILCLISFATLTVRVNEQELHIQFGMGLIRKRFELRDVQTIRAVHNPWYYGWGIHLIPGGWLYNVSGWDAVELQMKDGSKFRIGTDDVQGLINGIEGYLKQL